MAKEQKTAAELYREERKARLAKSAKRNATKSHKVILSKGTKRAISVCITIAIIAVVVFAFLNASGVLERGKTIMTVGDTEIDKYEYAYYCAGVYYNYYETSYQYDSYYGEGTGVMFTGFDWSKYPQDQEYDGEIEGIENPTFMDAIEDAAKTQLKRCKSYVAYAAENNITLDEEELATIESNIQSVQSTAQASNYTLGAYLSLQYGDGMTEKLYRQIITEQTLAQKVEQTKNDEFAAVYTDEKVEEIFNSDVTAYGVVDLRHYTIKAQAELGEDGTTKAITEEAMAAAKAQAEDFADAVTDEASFLKAASDNEQKLENKDYALYLSDDTLTLMEDATYSSLGYDNNDEAFADWAFNAERTAGEVYIAEVAETGYKVYMIVEPLHKVASTYTYDVRHILLQFPEETEETEETEEAEPTEEVTAELLDTSKYTATIDIDVDLETAKDPALYMKAQDVLIEYLEGDMTEDSFAELAKTHSADGNAAEGGIYEAVNQGDMVAEFEGWALEPGRKAGDVGIVETDYGYHIMYFIKTDEATSWITEIRDAKASEDFTAFDTELIEDASVAVANVKLKETEDVAELIRKMARNAINNANSGSYY